MSSPQEPWRCRCRNFFSIGTAPGFLPFVRVPSPPTFSSSSLIFDRLSLLGGMKFAFKIITKPITQAAIIISVVAFSSRLLPTIPIYLIPRCRVDRHRLCDHSGDHRLPHPPPLPRVGCHLQQFFKVVSMDPLTPQDNWLVAAPLLTRVPPMLTAFPPVGLLILRVSPPPGSSDPKEFYYDLLPAITQGLFAAPPYNGVQTTRFSQMLACKYPMVRQFCCRHHHNCNCFGTGWLVSH